MGSFETAPTLSCPTGERLVLPHAVGDHLLDRALTPTQIVNAYVAQTAGWTNDHGAFARTVARKVAQSNPETYEVDVRDRENSRLGVFVVTKSDAGFVLMRSYECATPVVKEKTAKERVASCGEETLEGPGRYAVRALSCSRPISLPGRSR